MTLEPGWWARGLTLAERRGRPSPPALEPDSDLGRAERRLARWRDAHRLAESGQFDGRLAAAGLQPPQLLELLAESRASLAARASRPAWAQLTEAVLDRLPETRPVPDPAGSEPASWQAGFSVIVAPFVELGYERLAADARTDGLDDVADLGELRRGFEAALGATLVALATRTLVLELNVLRVTDQLTGPTPQHRFWSFVRHAAQRAGLVALLAEYPVLARLLAQATEHAVTSWLELLHRFAADRSRITADMCGGVDPGRLVEVVAGRGDTHHRGRSVALLRFADGTRLVYKPRALAAHIHFNQCLEWLNRQVDDLALPTLAVLDRDRYGWVEFAEHQPCPDRAGVARYYRRLGALVAVLHALDGADFHFENLIACGDAPVLIDLEALLQPRLPDVGPPLLMDDPAMATLRASVSRIGLLPTLIFGEDGTALDMSGAGGDAGVPLPFKTAGWEQAGTDEMRLVREHPAFSGSQNRPRVGDTEIDPSDFAAELVDGFRAAYDAITASPADWTGPRGLLMRFAADEVRLVARPTRVYAMLLYESTHPDVLRDALDRDQTLDYLWAVSADDPARQRLVDYEQADLWAGDIPFFAARPDSRDVWTSDGVRLEQMLATEGLDRAIRNVARLGPADRSTQEWIIQASFAARRASTAGLHRPGPRAGSPGPSIPDGATADPDSHSERALRGARGLGDRLASTAHHDGDRIGWLGLEFVTESRWQVQPLRCDLYNGNPGVALFLGQLAELTGEQRYAELARGVVAELRRQIDTINDLSKAPCGAFGCLTGVAYALVHLATSLAEPDLLDAVEPLVAAVRLGLAQDDVLDVIGGSAGTLVAMLSIADTTGLAIARQAAQDCADRLVQSAQPQDCGVAWRTTVAATEPLTGFSHGASGIGWALLRYAAATGERRYAEIGLDAFRYERSRYRPELGNWPDFRAQIPAAVRAANGSLAPMHAWCHGSAGIGLARADCRHTDDPEVAADLDVALAAMLSAGPDVNLSLCHGQLGSLELLTAAVGRRSDLAATHAAWATHALDSFERSGPVCGTPGGVVTPSLMVGVAGVGHGLLRLAFPDRVPSILLLQRPIDNGRREAVRRNATRKEVDKSPPLHPTNQEKA